MNPASYGFSPFAVPTLVTAALMLFFGAGVMVRRMSRVAGAFFAISAAASVWLIAFTFLYCAKDAATALFWSRVAYLGVPFLAPAIYHFTAEMLRIAKDRRGAIGAGWGMAIVFSALAVTGVLVDRVQHYWWGFYPRYSLLAAPPFLLFFFGYLIASLVEFVRAFPKSRGIEKKRIRLLIIAFGVAYLGCVDYLPKFGFAVYPFGYAALCMRSRRRRASICSSSTTAAASNGTRSDGRSRALPTSGSGVSATSPLDSPPKPRCASRSCGTGYCSSRTRPAFA